MATKRPRWERGLFRAYLVLTIIFVPMLGVPYTFALVRFLHAQKTSLGFWVGSTLITHEEGFLSKSLLFLGGPHYVCKTVTLFCIGILPWILHPIVKWIVKGFLPDKENHH